MSKKMYSIQSHLFVTLPEAKTGLCKIGLSQYALKYFVRFHKVTYDSYPKSRYGVQNSLSIKLFLNETFQTYKNQVQMKEKSHDFQKKMPQNTSINYTKSLLTQSQKMQYRRFYIKKGEGFAKIQTYECDLELQAPVDMRLIDLNHDTYYWSRILTAPYLFQIQCLNMGQLQNLVTQEEYMRAPKFFEYC